MTREERAENLRRAEVDLRCIDCRKLCGRLLCAECAAVGPRGSGRCQVYECFELADGWGSCVWCREAKARAMAVRGAL